MSVKIIAISILFVITGATLSCFIWSKGDAPMRLAPLLDSGLEKHLIESNVCSNPKDCAEKLNELNTTHFTKTNYCCVVKYKSDVFLNNVWHKCRGHREWANTFGRITAEYRCRGISINWTSGDSKNSGWSAGTEFARDLVVRDCKDEDRCSNGGKTPWIVPVCNEGDSQFVRRVECKFGFWVENNFCKNGKWVRMDVDGGCRNNSGEPIK